jgi:hypothetical protein
MPGLFVLQKAAAVRFRIKNRAARKNHDAIPPFGVETWCLRDKKTAFSELTPFPPSLDMIKKPLFLFRQVTALGALAALTSACQAAIVVGGSLLVDVDATAWSGSGSMANAGSLGGSFEPNGTPTKVQAAGVSGAFLDGSDAFVGPATNNQIDGASDRTVEVWVYQGAVNGEETLVAWGKRGGGDGTNNSVNWGNNATFGAYGGWGAGPDQGFGAGQPARGQWQHIVFTADATNKSVYVNGTLATQELNNSPALNTHAGLNMLLGAQNAAAAAPGTPVIDAGNKLQGVLGKVRVHDTALSAADVLNNYNEEKGSYQNVPQPAAPLAAGPTHRWSFNEPTGTSFADTGTAGSPATAAALLGAGANVTGSGVDLPGGSSATAAYIDLPNNVASGKDLSAGGYSSVTYEVWVTTGTNQTWSRIVDFGTNTAGEVTGPGGAFDGTNYFLLSNNIGDSADMRMERTGGTAGTRDAVGATIGGTEQYIAITYDSADGMWKWFQNGLLMEGFASDAPGNLNDVNNWLGRSNWAGDANTDATYNEFRIYDYALSPAEIQQNLFDGPNQLTVVPEPTVGLLGLLGLGFLSRRRRRS